MVFPEKNVFSIKVSSIKKSKIQVERGNKKITKHWKQHDFLLNFTMLALETKHGLMRKLSYN